DEQAIRQVILNVLSNAIKFTPQGGTIKIRIGRTTSGGQFVAVRDSGPGIPEDEIPIVMSYFGRGSHAQTHAAEGSGLGLPIAKGLVELHGGTVTLNSKLREGTEVAVIFPPSRIRRASAEAGENGTALAAAQRRRIFTQAAGSKSGANSSRKGLAFCKAAGNLSRNLIAHGFAASLPYPANADSKPN